MCKIRRGSLCLHKGRSHQTDRNTGLAGSAGIHNQEQPAIGRVEQRRLFQAPGDCLTEEVDDSILSPALSRPPPSSILCLLLLPVADPGAGEGSEIEGLSAGAHELNNSGTESCSSLYAPCSMLRCDLNDLNDFNVFLFFD